MNRTMKNLKYFWLLVTCLSVGLAFAQKPKKLEDKAKWEELTTELSYDIHLIAEASTNQISVDNVLNIEYRLYVSQTVGISGWETLEYPLYEGFDFETIQIENRIIDNVFYKGKSYRMVVLRKDILKPTTSGDYNLKPLQLQITANIADTANTNERTKLSMKKVISIIASNALKINVTP